MPSITLTNPIRTATHCPYCALQCGMYLSVTNEQVCVIKHNAFPVNKGALCVKGWVAPETLSHPDRLTLPLMRDASGTLVPVTWDTALDQIVRVFLNVQKQYGKNALGVFGGGALTNEKAYLLGKFARVALGTAHIDYNGRFCMASAATAAQKAFGIDRGLPFPLEDIATCETILLVGSNIVETMPPLMQYFLSQRKNGGSLIVVDPRRTLTAKQATLHLGLLPGSDTVLANGLLHILIRKGLIDQAYICERTENFEEMKSVIAMYPPERVQQITGVPIDDFEHAAHLLGMASSAMVLTSRGAEQQSQGVDNTLAYINIALALGLAGKPGSGYGSITGQGNGQGGREHGQKSDQLPGYRRIDNLTDRHDIAGIWGIDEQDMPGPGKSAYELLDTIGQEGCVRALLMVGSNPVVSAPRAMHVQERIKALDFLVVADYFLSETAQYAHIVLPIAQWAEEEGTMTNLEGRVILRKKACEPPAGVRTDLEVLCDLARRLGRGKFFPFTESRQVFDELRRASANGIADYAGITYEKIEANHGVFWPCPTETHPGTPRLFRDSFPTSTGKALFHTIQHRQPAEVIDDLYPLYLTTGRLLAHYQSGTQTRRVALLQAMAPSPYVEIHPKTMRRFLLTEGIYVKIISRRGWAVLMLKETLDIREDTVFVPFHWGGLQSVNRLTNAALDPISRMPEFKVCAVRIEYHSTIVAERKADIKVDSKE